MVWVVSWLTDEDIYTRVFHNEDDAMYCYNSLIFYDFREVFQTEIE